MKMQLVNTVLLVVSLTISASNAVEVTTSLGNIRGTTMTSRLGGSFYAFRGIRYAEPPVNDLRFQNPVPVKSWKPKVFDASVDGPMCPQVTTNTSDVSEDCLRLNVYTKDIHGRKPVVVYIHPGGFYAVSGQSKNFAGPQNLMDRDIVLVSINYRLGSLGFLATGTKDAPGNAGLKDQVIALRWIKEHIQHFGGDANAITLFGYSAGSSSIGLHMLSPMSKGLFQRGIMMSASPLGQWEYSKSDMRLATRQARLLECPTQNTEEMVKCMKKKPMMEFVNTSPEMFDFKWNPILNWRPAIEEDFGQERYLIEHPYKTIQSGDFHKVPLITGITKYEFVNGAYYTLANETTKRWFNEEFEKYAPIAFLYERNTPKSREVSAILRKKYLKDTTLRLPESLDKFGELYSDSVIGFEFHRFLDLISRHVPVYTYLFTYKGRYSHFELPDGQIYGAVHHDELLYLLHVPVMTPMFKQTDPENETIERLTRMWTEFAKKGDPNNANDEFLKNVNWKLYSKQKMEYLEIGSELNLREGGIYLERFRIWDELFPIPEKHLL